MIWIEFGDILLIAKQYVGYFQIYLMQTLYQVLQTHVYWLAFILCDLWIWNISKIRLILIKEYLSFLMDIKCHMLLFTWTIKTNQKFNILINILVAIIIRISENKYVWVKKNNNVIDLNVSSLIFYTSFKIWFVQCVG